MKTYSNDNHNKRQCEPNRAIKQIIDQTAKQF